MIRNLRIATLWGFWFARITRLIRYFRFAGRSWLIWNLWLAGHPWPIRYFQFAGGSRAVRFAEFS